MATAGVQEFELPPPLFDGTTRSFSPFPSGLQNEIKLVPIDLQDKPTWHKEKVHPENKVPSLEHNGKDPAKKEFGEQLIVYVDTFTKEVFSSFRGGDPVQQSSASFDYLENAVGKIDDGPFFLAQFSLELNKFDAYKQTKVEPEVFLNVFKKHFSGRP